MSRSSRSLGLAAMLFLAPTARTQNFALDWSTIDGGGGTSSGGAYTISATIGQPDAGLLIGGSIVIEGGFWFGEIPLAAPHLSIVRSGANVVLFWSPMTQGLVLQTSDSLAPPTWMDAPSASMNPVTIGVNSGTRYFRLIQR